MEQLRMRTFVLRDERRPVNLRAYALGPKHDADVVLSDLSYAGCQIRSADTFEPGEILELRVIKRGLLQAEIRWAREGRAGARFIGS